MKQRVLTGSALIAFLILLFFSKQVTPFVFDAFVVLLASYAGFEMSCMLRKIGMYNNKWCIIFYPVVSYALYKICVAQNINLYISFVMQIALVILISAAVALVGVIFKKATENEVKTRKLKISVEQFSLFKGVQTLFGLLYPGFIVMLLLVLNNLNSLNNWFVKYNGFGNEMSIFFLVLTFVIPVFVDTFAMLTGSLFKGPKLCPNISPKKTVSGAIGGFVWGTVCSVALFFIFNSINPFMTIFIDLNLTWWKVLIVGGVASIFCQFGDIFESFIKRKAGVKDSGDFLPGHGGILDRIDSHIVSIIIVFIFMLVL